MNLSKKVNHYQITSWETFLFQRLMFCALLLFIYTHTSGQVTSEKGWVSATANKGCAGLEITLIHQRVAGGELFYSFEGNPDNPQGSIFDGAFSFGQSIDHTYTNAGTFTIIIIDQSQGLSEEDRIDRLEIDILPDDPPQAAITTCLGKTIQINFDKSNDPYDSYTVDFGDGTQQSFSGDDIVDYTYATVGTFDVEISGQFDNGDARACSTNVITVSILNVLPIPKLNALTVEDIETVNLSFEPLSENLSYQLEIDRGNGFEALVNIDPATNTNSFQYSSSQLNFRDEHYRFRIKAEDACGLFEAFSSVGNSIAFQIEPTAITNEITLTLNWSTSTEGFSELNFFSDNSLLETFDQANTTNDVPFSTTDCNDLQTFKMQGTFNGVLSTSLSIDPFLTSGLTLPAPPAPEVELLGANANVTLPTTDFTVSSYQVFRKDIDDQFLFISNAPGPTFVDVGIPLGTGEACYVISYEDACGNRSEQSQEFCLTLGSSLGIPNAFSPNNDGINDVFKIKEGLYINFSLEIFNRWGNLVFRTSTPEKAWDGSFEGKPAPAGSYTYRISFQGTDKVLFTKAGSFLLIR